MTLDELARAVRAHDLQERLARRLNRPIAQVAALLESKLRQVPVTLELLADIDLVGKRLLEIGAGPGLASIFLKANGYDITAIEPALSGFDEYAVYHEELIRTLGHDDLTLLVIGAEELDSAIHGLFDVIFSHNVLEHVPQLDEAFAAMCGVLKPGGVMVHMCVNYNFPYEPHFSIPLIPGWPKLTEIVLPRRIRDSQLWQCLNFIDAGQVRALCKRNGLQVGFAPGLLHAQLVRIQEDPTFGARHHGALLKIISRMLRLTGLFEMLRHLPPVAVSPMRFVAAKLPPTP
ncbi:class I SAM-dependent methyltransferase [Paramagnetospirillum kuznetsovii]|nr:class I SAM-dependent methyltransferase [Paramagnetospirillum kuznetsovii]